MNDDTHTVVPMSEHIIFSWRARVFRNFSCFWTTLLCFFDNLYSFILKLCKGLCSSSTYTILSMINYIILSS